MTRGSFPDLDLDFGPPLDVFLEVERVRAAELEQGLPVFDLAAGLREPGGDFVGDDADPVLVGVDQVAGADLDAGDLDGLAEPDEPDIGVAYARVQPEQGEVGGRTSSRSRGQPSVMWPMQPSFLWIELFTSPNWAPRPGGSSRSCPTAIFGPGCAAT